MATKRQERTVRQEVATQVRSATLPIQRDIKRLSDDVESLKHSNERRDEMIGEVAAETKEQSATLKQLWLSDYNRVLREAWRDEQDRKRWDFVRNVGIVMGILVAGGTVLGMLVGLVAWLATHWR